MSEIHEQQKKEKNEEQYEDAGLYGILTDLPVKGLYGTWHSIDVTDIQGERFFLMESDEYGKLVDNIAVNEEGELVAEDLCRGFDARFHEALKKYFSEKDIVYEPDEKKPSIMDKLAQMQDKAKSGTERGAAEVSRKTSRNHAER